MQRSTDAVGADSLTLRPEPPYASTHIQAPRTQRTLSTVSTVSRAVPPRASVVVGLPQIPAIPSAVSHHPNEMSSQHLTPAIASSSEFAMHRQSTTSVLAPQPPPKHGLIGDEPLPPEVRKKRLTNTNRRLANLYAPEMALTPKKKKKTPRKKPKPLTSLAASMNAASDHLIVSPIPATSDGSVMLATPTPSKNTTEAVSWSTLHPEAKTPATSSTEPKKPVTAQALVPSAPPKVLKPPTGATKRRVSSKPPATTATPVKPSTKIESKEKTPTPRSRGAASPHPSSAAATPSKALATPRRPSVHLSEQQYRDILIKKLHDKSMDPSPGLEKMNPKLLLQEAKTILLGYPAQNLTQLVRKFELVPRNKSVGLPITQIIEMVSVELGRRADAHHHLQSGSASPVPGGGGGGGEFSIELPAGIDLSSDDRLLARGNMASLLANLESRRRLRLERIRLTLDISAETARLEALEMEDFIKEVGSLTTPGNPQAGSPRRPGKPTSPIRFGKSKDDEPKKATDGVLDFHLLFKLLGWAPTGAQPQSQQNRPSSPRASGRGGANASSGAAVTTVERIADMAVGFTQVLCKTAWSADWVTKLTSEQARAAVLSLLRHCFGVSPEPTLSDKEIVQMANALLLDGFPMNIRQLFHQLSPPNSVLLPTDDDGEIRVGVMRMLARGDPDELDALEGSGGAASFAISAPNTLNALARRARLGSFSARSADFTPRELIIDKLVRKTRLAKASFDHLSDQEILDAGNILLLQQSAQTLRQLFIAVDPSKLTSTVDDEAIKEAIIKRLFRKTRTPHADLHELSDEHLLEEGNVFLVGAAPTTPRQVLRKAALVDVVQGYSMEPSAMRELFISKINAITGDVPSALAALEDSELMECGQVLLWSKEQRDLRQLLSRAGVGANGTNNAAPQSLNPAEVQEALVRELQLRTGLSKAAISGMNNEEFRMFAETNLLSGAMPTTLRQMLRRLGTKSDRVDPTSRLTEQQIRNMLIAKLCLKTGFESEEVCLWSDEELLRTLQLTFCTVECANFAVLLRRRGVPANVVNTLSKLQLRLLAIEDLHFHTGEERSVLSNLSNDQLLRKCTGLVSDAPAKDFRQLLRKTGTSDQMVRRIPESSLVETVLRLLARQGVNIVRSETTTDSQILFRANAAFLLTKFPEHVLEFYCSPILRDAFAATATAASALTPTTDAGGSLLVTKHQPRARSPPKPLNASPRPHSPPSNLGSSGTDHPALMSAPSVLIESLVDETVIAKVWEPNSRAMLVAQEQEARLALMEMMWSPRVVQGVAFDPFFEEEATARWDLVDQEDFEWNKLLGAFVSVESKNANKMNAQESPQLSEGESLLVDSKQGFQSALLSQKSLRRSCTGLDGAAKSAKILGFSSSVRPVPIPTIEGMFSNGVLRYHGWYTAVYGQWKLKAADVGDHPTTLQALVNPSS